MMVPHDYSSWLKSKPWWLICTAATECSRMWSANETMIRLQVCTKAQPDRRTAQELKCPGLFVCCCVGDCLWDSSGEGGEAGPVPAT